MARSSGKELWPVAGCDHEQAVARICGQKQEAVARSSGKELWPVVGCGQEQAVARICRQKQGKYHDDELGFDSSPPGFRVI